MHVHVLYMYVSILTQIYMYTHKHTQSHRYVNTHTPAYEKTYGRITQKCLTLTVSCVGKNSSKDFYLFNL